MGRCQKVPKFNFKVNFLCQKLLESFGIFFSSKNVNLEAYFLLLTFFENFSFESSVLLKSWQFFDLLIQNLH